MKHTALILLAALSLAACSTFTAARNDAVWQLGKQVAIIGAGAVGVNVTAAQLDGAAALIRTLAGKKDDTGKPTKAAPTHTEAVAALESGTGDTEAAKRIATLVPLLRAAIAKGAPPDAAIEETAAKLNATAAKTRADAAKTKALSTP